MTPVTVDIWIDLSCPWCYLAINAFRKALSETEFAPQIESVVRPFFLDPEPAEPALPETLVENLMRRKNLTTEAAITELQKLEESGRDCGISFNINSASSSSTLNAQHLVALAHHFDELNDECVGADTLQLRVTEALQRSYFELGLDISDPEILIGIGQDYKIPAASTLSAIRGDESIAAGVTDGYTLALHLGVDSVPLFLFDEQFVVEGNHSVESFMEILRTVCSQHIALTEKEKS